MQRKERKVVQSKKGCRKRSHTIYWQDWILQSFMMGLFNISYCHYNQYEKLENNYNTSFWKSQHFFKKSERTHMLGPPPLPSMTPPIYPQRTYFLNDPLSKSLISIDFLKSNRICFQKKKKIKMTLEENGRKNAQNDKSLINTIYMKLDFPST